MAWIHPAPEEGLVGLDTLSNDELLVIAQTVVPSTHARRLQDLLAAQRQRSLTASEQQEAAKLVEQEDRLTPHKSKALLLLKQRGVLPNELRALCVISRAYGESSFTIPSSLRAAPRARGRSLWYCGSPG